MREFVDAAYALMVRTYAGIPGKNMLEAIELANESFGLAPPVPEGATDDALNQLAAMRRGAQ